MQLGVYMGVGQGIECVFATCSIQDDKKIKVVDKAGKVQLNTTLPVQQEVHSHTLV